MKWAVHWQQDDHTTVVTKASYATVADAANRRAVKWTVNEAWRVIETVGTWLCDRFGLKRPRVRTYWGLLAPIAANIAAFNRIVYVNHV